MPLSRLLACASLAVLGATVQAQFEHPPSSGKKAKPPTRQEFERMFRNVKLNDGWATRNLADTGLLRAAARVSTIKPLDAAQATILARAYFSMRSGGCGYIEWPFDYGVYWGFPTREGYAGAHGEIRVVKASGRTFEKGSFTVNRPRDFAKYLPKR